MQGRPIRYHAVAFLALGLLFAAANASIANAQSAAEPQVVITWQAEDSYAPPGYAGKILPNAGSQITASIAALGANGPVSLAGQTIYWYLNDTLLGGGVNAQHLTFRPGGQAPETVTLRVEVPDYSSGLLISELDIPVVQPKVIIEAPYPDGNFSTNQPTVQALPYFFATTSTSPLSFAWSVNGQTVSDALNPQSLQISLPNSTPSGFGVDVSLTVQNPNDSTIATASTNLTYQPHP